LFSSPRDAMSLRVLELQWSTSMDPFKLGVRRAGFVDLKKMGGNGGFSRHFTARYLSPLSCRCASSGTRSARLRVCTAPREPRYIGVFHPEHARGSMRGVTRSTTRMALCWVGHNDRPFLAAAEEAPRPRAVRESQSRELPPSRHVQGPSSAAEPRPPSMPTFRAGGRRASRPGRPAGPGDPPRTPLRAPVTRPPPACRLPEREACRPPPWRSTARRRRGKAPARRT